jgi:hypothetical protein
MPKKDTHIRFLCRSEVSDEVCTTNMTTDRMQHLLIFCCRSFAGLKIATLLWIGYVVPGKAKLFEDIMCLKKATAQDTLMRVICASYKALMASILSE